MLRSLAKVAMLTGRTAAWPAIPCSAPFWNNTYQPPNPCLFHLEEDVKASVGLASRPDFLVTGPLHNLTCIWSPLLSSGCTKHELMPFTGMLPLEFEHYLRDEVTSWERDVVVVKEGSGQLAGAKEKVGGGKVGGVDGERGRAGVCGDCGGERKRGEKVWSCPSMELSPSTAPAWQGCRKWPIALPACLIPPILPRLPPPLTWDPPPPHYPTSLTCVPAPPPPHPLMCRSPSPRQRRTTG